MEENVSAKEFKIVDIARTQLETAIRLFFYAEDYFSVVTLAGASEEILGKILVELGKEPSHASYSRTFSLVVEALSGEQIPEKTIKKSTNRARNKLKHFNSMQDLHVVLNPREEAIHMLNRAIENYVKLNLPKSEVIDRFRNYDMECL